MSSKTVRKHPFHLVDPSPWPLLGGFAALTSTIGGVIFIHAYKGGAFVLALGLLFIIYTIYVWWRDIVREATFEGHHTLRVQLGIRYGIILFIVSEVIFFLAFFWAFFHASLAPSPEIGGIWPPKGIDVFNPYDVPLLNTVILLSSGATVTWAHHAILAGRYSSARIGLTITIALGAFFTACQALEYGEATFRISDSVYGSSFFVATGFHGLHVLIGTTFLYVCLLRLQRGHFTIEHHFGFEAAAWYWHFVDVVWLFLYCFIYIWSYHG